MAERVKRQFSSRTHLVDGPTTMHLEAAAPSGSTQGQYPAATVGIKQRSWRWAEKWRKK